ncbi:MAG: glutamine--fructose-6-phosphate transaminase (isomerizing) [Firmicutes bacterium]|nr:glutamine--fructose-6-phosphate transaminase (isomerizing) [Bacillota bacterium]
MCGIVGYVGLQSPQNFLIDGLEKLEYRGYDSAGVAVVNEGEIKIRKAVGPIVNLRKVIGDEDLGGRVGIGHTRWATHGGVTVTNAHPHFNSDKTIAVVHNGTVENYIELKAKLQAEGVEFISDTDTEVACMLIAEHFKKLGDLKAAMDAATKEMEGTFVLVAVAADQPDKLVAYRRNAPLIAAKGKNFNFVASDFSAILKHTKDVFLIENGDTVVLTKDAIEIFDEDDKPVKRELMHIGWDVDAADKGDYEHFMLKEIHEQPKGIQETLSRSLTEDDRIKLYGIDMTAEQLNSYNKIIIVACGTAYHAGLVGQYFIEKIAGIPVQIDVASEFRYRRQFIDEKTLFIAVSQSGETADTLEALREAKKQGAHILSIVNVVGSSVARESDEVFYTWAGPEISVASTKAYTTQLLCLYMLALYFADLKGTIEPDDYADYVAQLKRIPSQIEEILKKEQDIERLAYDYYDRDQVFFIGRGLDSSVAFEGSLKLKEVSYIPSFAIAAGEMKHGTIALMEPRTIVIALATQDAIFDKTVSNIQEIKARNAHIISIAKEGNTSIVNHSNEVIYIPECRDELTPLLTVVPLQLYAYFVAKDRHCEIDKPRNLAKSVTVE